ncbi:MAG: single-stranded-DNA-specific exonuclease RecJ [Oscillospiraceae bacterium]|nr:single-stranded-DNA-specific exonuclease RecJ [Oscillospiraceae bacterium]
MNYNKWKVAEAEAERPSALLAAGYNPLLASLLNLRGISEPGEAERFLYGGAEILEEPLLMKGMPQAVKRIRAAIERRECLAVYGDYDVDGITSTCLLTDWLRSMGLVCHSYIPDRIKEGYGLNCGAIEKLKNMGVSLIISVDCGITAAEEADFARRLGVDLIITDHHECREQTLPVACAVIDPKQEGCGYPNKDLAGVGVALKLACAVEGDSSSVIDRYADIAAIGTVADVVPLTGENRYIVRRGLAKLEDSPRLGIEALLKESGAADRKVSSSTIGFSLAPRLNAAGRLGCVDVALELLMTEEPAAAERLAAELCELNRRRQSLETDIWQEACDMMEAQQKDTPIVLSSERWHQGVIGIAASKLAEQYALPTVMICLDGDKGKGSCRSYGGFNIFDALSACSEHLEGFGGHALAAGLNIKRDKLGAFCRAFAEYYRINRPRELPTLSCDLCIREPEMLSVENVESLSILEPFGSGNPRPLLCIKGARLDKLTPIGGGKHLRISVSFRTQGFECVFFSHTESDVRVREGDCVDLAFTPQINEFRFRKSVQLQLSAIKRHDGRELCGEILGGSPELWEAAAFCPDRPSFVKVWRRLESEGGRVARDLDGVMRQCPYGVEPEKFCICLVALSELGLLGEPERGLVYGARMTKNSQKVRLEDSELIKKLRARLNYGR